MARILLLNPAPREGVAFVREARCSIRESLKGTPFPCLTLARLAACLRSKGHEICLVDASAERLSVSDVINRVERRGAPPDLIIFATATPTIKSDCLGVGQLRRHWGANTLTFGAHCSGLREQVLREHAEIDALLVGEPEDPVVELCGRMDAMGFDVAVAALPSSLFRTPQGEIAGEGRGYTETTLDRLPVPAWDLLDYRKYRIPVLGHSYLMVEVNRGCPFGCKFCTAALIHGRKLRVRSPRAIVDEIERYQREYGVDWFYLWGDTALTDRQFVVTLCEEILSRKLQVRWFCNSRCDRLTFEEFRLMKQSGCWMISLGIESGSDATLARMGKGITTSDGRLTCAAARAAGILLLGFFVLGYPGETVEDMRRTVQFALELPLDYAEFAPSTPYPGTPLWEECQKSGWIAVDDFDRYEFSNYVLDTGVLNEKSVLRVQAAAYRRFYLRPRIIAGHLRLLAHPRYWLAIFERLRTWLSWCMPAQTAAK